MKRVMVLRHVANLALGNLEVVLRGCGLELDVVDCFADRWPAVERTGFDLGAHPAAEATAEPSEAELEVLRGEVRARMIETGTYPEWARTHLGAAA